MKNNIIIIALTSLIFTAGILTYWYIKDMQRGIHRVSGIIKYHTPDYTISADAPEGYYINLSTTHRMYIENENIHDYLNKYVYAQGYLKETCGNDGGSCYPLIIAQRLEPRNEMENCKTWFDGCNSCSVILGQIGTCTERFCKPYEYEEAKCLKYK